jgi:hypothetical protein
MNLDLINLALGGDILMAIDIFTLPWTTLPDHYGQVFACRATGDEDDVLIFSVVPAPLSSELGSQLGDAADAIAKTIVARHNETCG